MSTPTDPELARCTCGVLMAVGHYCANQGHIWVSTLVEPPRGLVVDTPHGHVRCDCGCGFFVVLGRWDATGHALPPAERPDLLCGRCFSFYTWRS